MSTNKLPELNREFQESPWEQGINEDVPHTVTTTPWGSTPKESTISVKLYDVSTEGVKTDVTSTAFPTNSPTVNGDVITLSKLIGSALTAGKKYRLEVKFTVENGSGGTFEPYGYIYATE